MLTNHNKPKPQNSFRHHPKEKSLKPRARLSYYSWLHNYYNNNHTHSCTHRAGERERQRENESKLTTFSRKFSEIAKKKNKIYYR